MRSEVSCREVPHARSARAIAAALIILSFCAGCVSDSSPPRRTSFTEAEHRAAEVVGMPGVRFFVDSPGSFQRWRERNAGTATPLTIAREQEDGLVWLALSGGADDGAYGAGILNGWTIAGARPRFTVVSGVSTGALIGMLAFLGPHYDPLLAALYTETPREGIYRPKGRAGVLGQSILDETPFRMRVAEVVDAKALAEVAREHATGRRFLVVTTNLDAQRATVWDMGAIAASTHPNALKLFRDVLIASASPPGLFAPTYIEVEANGRRFQEMHVDGAVGDPVFSPADVLVLTRGMAPETEMKRTLYVLVNNKLKPQFEVVENTTIPIVYRSFSTLAMKSLVAEVYRANRVARENDIDFNLTFIDEEFRSKPTESFDLEYRRQLFAYGKERALTGEIWVKRPPAAE
jgi:hypothetical protein